MKRKITLIKDIIKLNGKKVIWFYEYGNNNLFTEAVVNVENDLIYLCQNKLNGAGCNNKLGYNFSWLISSSLDMRMDASGYLVEHNQQLEFDF
jgi:hypothetical protein